MKESHTLPQVLPVVIRGHIIDVNLVTFLGNERKADTHEVDRRYSRVKWCTVYRQVHPPPSLGEREWNIQKDQQHKNKTKPSRRLYRRRGRYQKEYWTLINAFVLAGFVCTRVAVDDTSWTSALYSRSLSSELLLSVSTTHANTIKMWIRILKNALTKHIHARTVVFHIFTDMTQHVWPPIDLYCF